MTNKHAIGKLSDPLEPFQKLATRSVHQLRFLKGKNKAGFAAAKKRFYAGSDPNALILNTSV